MVCSGMQKRLCYAICWAKIAHPCNVPQGQVEADKRTLAMVEAMDKKVLHKHICMPSLLPEGTKADFIKDMNVDFLKAKFKAVKNKMR